ncbi:MAG: hypothetical protein J6A01_05350 [Proteobacteria bacterium]|nr:hypothetical protein [Pseudomonadota bacterium]
MSIFTITYAELEETNRWLFETVTDSLDVVAKLLTDNEVAVPCVPRYAAGYLVPYSFAGNLRLLFEYARGRKKLSRPLIEKMTIDFYRLMNFSPMTLVRERASEDADDDIIESEKETADFSDALHFASSLLPRTIAVILIGANARIQVENNCWISSTLLEVLTGILPDQAESEGIKKRMDEMGHWEYDPVTVQSLLKKLDKTDFH